MSKENTTLKDDLLALGIDITGAQTKAKETNKQMLIASMAVVVAMAVDSNVCVQLFKR